MKTTIEISNNTFPVSLESAEVIHADKYTEASGGWGSLPVHSFLYTDVVFRTGTDKKDWHLKINHLDLPIYRGQQVLVICVNNSIIGFIDRQTSKYYYTVTDFAKLLCLGMAYYWVWVIGVLAGLIALVFTWKDEDGFLPLLFFMPIAAMWLIYHAQKWLLNGHIKQQIDQYLREE